LGRRLQKYVNNDAVLNETNELVLEMHALQAEDWKTDQPLSIAASTEDAPSTGEEIDSI